MRVPVACPCSFFLSIMLTVNISSPASLLYCIIRLCVNFIPKEGFGLKRLAFRSAASFLPIPVYERKFSDDMITEPIHI